MKFLINLIFFIPITGLSQIFQVDTLLLSGNPDNRINIVILGDGFTESEQNLFLNEADKTLSEFLETDPYKSYNNRFNFFTIKVISPVSGAANNPDALINNFFGSTFGYAGIDRLLVPTKINKIWGVLATHFPNYDEVILLVNSSKYGGSGGVIATSSIASSANQIIIHELGHSFGGLEDEYWAGEELMQESPNVTRERASDKIKWKNWLGDNDIGIFQFEENKNWVRPHQSCKMRFLGSDFCSVCMETLYRKINQMTNLIDDYHPNSITAFDTTFWLSPIYPDPNTIKTVWHQNEVEILSHKDSLITEDPGQNVKAYTYDITPLDRSELITVHVISWDSDLDEVIENTILLNRDSLPNLNSTFKTDFFVSAYPNPTSLESISLDLLIYKQTDLIIRILDLSGKSIYHFKTPEMKAGNHSLEIDLKNLEYGNYLLIAMNNRGKQSLKFIKK